MNMRLAILAAALAGSGWAFPGFPPDEPVAPDQPGKLRAAGPPEAAPAESSDFPDSGVLETDELAGEGPDIHGVLVDGTVTRFGRIFFDAFQDSWRPIEGVRYRITVGERFDPGGGILITVTLDRTVVFEGFITPREEGVRELARAVAADVRITLRNRISLGEEEL